MNKLYIVGKGSGDPELITVKALKRLAECQVILCAGSLVPRAIIEPYEEKARLVMDTASMALPEIIE